jgi:hypothetical protein
MAEYLQDVLDSETMACSDSKKRKTDGKKSLTCDCEEHGADCIAFDTQGCLKCPRGDCAYYIQNFIETFLQCRSVKIYPRTVK